MNIVNCKSEIDQSGATLHQRQWYNTIINKARTPGEETQNTPASNRTRILHGLGQIPLDDVAISTFILQGHYYLHVVILVLVGAAGAPAILKALGVGGGTEGVVEGTLATVAGGLQWRLCRRVRAEEWRILGCPLVYRAGHGWCETADGGQGRLR